MSAARYRKTVKLPHGYTVKFSIRLGEHFECRWMPEMPPPEIGRKILEDYQRERNDFLASLGVPMLVVDL